MSGWQVFGVAFAAALLVVFLQTIASRIGEWWDDTGRDWLRRHAPSDSVESGALPEHTAEEIPVLPVNAPIEREFDRRTPPTTPDAFLGLPFDGIPIPPETGFAFFTDGVPQPPGTATPADGRTRIPHGRHQHDETAHLFVPRPPDDLPPQWGLNGSVLHTMTCESGIKRIQPMPELPIGGAGGGDV